MHSHQRIIDLTHTLSAAAPTWDGGCGFEIATTTDYADCTAPDLFRVQKITAAAGVGTHMDAPAHVIPGGATIEQIALTDLIADCVVIDVRGAANASYLILPEAILDFEKVHGTIAPRSFVIFYTGWDQYWNDRKRYHNDHQFPSVAPATAALLLERNIIGLGIDTLSADTGKNGFPVHRALLGAGVYLVENVANAGQLPPRGARVSVIPTKIQGATEAPVRMFAEIL